MRAFLRKNKDNVHSSLMALMLLWGAFAMVYIVIDIQQALTDRQVAVEAGYQQGLEAGAKQGQTEIITQIISRAKSCQPVNLFTENETQRVETIMMDINCPAPQVAPPPSGS